MRARMVSGEMIASIPIYGFSKAADGKLEIDETAANVVRQIFDLALQGLLFEEISAMLTAARYPTPSESIRLAKGRDVSPACLWTNKMVRDILKNPQYTGAYVSGKYLKDHTGKRFHAPKSDWIVIPDKHPAIISEAMFAEVQEIMTSRRVKRTNMRPRDYLLRGGILKCGCCGYALVYDDSCRNTVYRCGHTIADSGAQCHKMTVNARELESAVLDIIRKQAEVVIGAADLSGLRKTSEDERHTADCERQLRECTELRQHCYEQFVQREIDHKTFRAMKAEYAARIERLENQLAVLKQAQRDKESVAKAAAIAREVLSKTTTNREIVETLIERVFVSPGNNIRIE